MSLPGWQLPSITGGVWVVYRLVRGLIKDFAKGVGWFTTVTEHIGDTKTAIDSLDERVTSLDKAVGQMQKSIRRVLLVLFPGEPTFESGSPLRLTESGQEIADELDAASWVEKIIPQLRDRTKGEPPAVIEEVCFDYLVYSDDFQPAPELAAKIRATAYEHGVAREQVRGVLAIILRDELIRLESGSGAVNQPAM